MAQGSLYLFNSLATALFEAKHHGDVHTFKFALVDDTLTLSAATVNPTWGAAGTDLSANEVTGSGYTAGGIDIEGNFMQALATGTFDGVVNPSWAQDAAGPENIKYGVIYNDSITNKECVCFVEMTSGGLVSLRTGLVSYTFNASGVLTIEVDNTAA